MSTKQMGAVQTHFQLQILFMNIFLYMLINLKIENDVYLVLKFWSSFKI